MKIRNICVIGAGRMGRQIGLCAAKYGYNATVYDVNPAVLDDMRAWEEEYLAGRIAKKRMTEKQVEEIKGRFRISSDLAEACGDVQLVIEAIYENLDAKRDIFRKLSDLVGEDVILATNSSFMVSSLFKDCVKNPSRLCNMHFYNPVLVMLFVEVVQGEHTSEEAARAAYEFCLSMEKKPVWMKKELPGFLGNHIIKEMGARTSALVQDGYYSIFQEADTTMEQAIGRKMGPFHSADLTGIDLSFSMKESTYKRTGTKPALYDLFKEMVDKGRLGIKTGHGFYDYEAPFTVKPFIDREGAPSRKIRRIAVIGAGETGREVAREAAGFGYETALYDPDLAVRANASHALRPASEDAPHVRIAKSLKTAVRGADLVLDFLTGEKDEKAALALFARLDSLCTRKAILATNSRYLMPSTLAKAVKDPSRICTLHFTDPVTEEKYTEVVQGPETAEEVAGAAYDYCLAVGRKPVWLRKELPGLAHQYVLDGIAGAARFLVGDGYCTFQEVDLGMEYGMGFRLGYFKIADKIGLDVCLQQLEEEYARTGKKPDMIDTFRELCAQGRLGRKCGHGFYDYD